MAGFPCSIFSNKMKIEPYQCLICLDICRSPVTCESGAHLFCRFCLSESLRINPNCPVCRNPLVAPVPCAFVSVQVSIQDVVCIHHKCKWKGICGRLDGHLETDCLHQPIKCSGEGGCGTLIPRGEMAVHQQLACIQGCPNSKPETEWSDGYQDTCGVRLSRTDLIDHLRHHCQLRLTHCPYPPCDISTAQNRMPAHILTCPHAPVLCPLYCRTPNLARRSLDAHRSDCPNEPVPCVYAPLGCTHVASRGQISEHERDAAVHFLITSKAIIELKKANEQQCSQIQQTFERKLSEQDATFNKKLQEHAALLQNLQSKSALADRKLQEQAVLVNKLQNQVKLLESLDFIQPYLKAKAEAEAVINGLKCYWCYDPATRYFKNDKQAKQQDPSLCINGISGTCSRVGHRLSGYEHWGECVFNQTELITLLISKK